MKPILALLTAAMIAGAAAPAEARCVDNRSSVRVKVDIHAMWIRRIQDWLEPGQKKCFTYNFLADIRLDAAGTPASGTFVSGEAKYSFTTNATRITVTEKLRRVSDGLKYFDLNFCRDC